MTRRFLDVAGLLALLGLLAASVGSLILVKQRVTVLIAGETTSQKAGPDPAALLRDDVAALRSDLSALSQALSKNFETLAAADEQSATDRAKALDPLRDAMLRLGEHVASLETGVKSTIDAAAADRASAAVRDVATRRDAETSRAALLVSLDDLRARLDALGASRGADIARSSESHAPATAAETPAPMRPAVPVTPRSPAASVMAASEVTTSGPPSPSSAPPSTSLPAPPPPSPSLAGAPAVVPVPLATAPSGASPSSPTPSVAPAPASAAPSNRKPFLSFTLPSESLDLGRRLRFEIVPSLSRVGFDAKSTLHNFSGVTSEVAGSFVARLSMPGDRATGRVTAKVAGLDTGIEERNNEMAKTLDASRLPTIEFELSAFNAASTDAKTYASTGSGRGKMTIHGVSHDVTVPLRISLDESRRVLIEGEVPLRLTDYGIKPPSTAGLIRMEDEVRVWIALRARSVGPAE